MTRKVRLRAITIVAVPAALAFAAFVGWRAVGFTYSSGERVGFLEGLTSEGTLCDVYEGTVLMGLSPAGPGTQWRFSVRDRHVANEIAGLKGQRVAVHYHQEKGGQLVCSRKTEYVATGVRRLN